MNIPEPYRQKIASSLVGTPGVDPSGAMIGEGIAQPAFAIAEKQQSLKDEADYNRLMVQHKSNIMAATEAIKIKYASNPDAAGPAMLDAIKSSLAQVTEQSPNPRVKLMVGKGEPMSEMWNLKEVYQWSSQQEYHNLAEQSQTLIDKNSKMTAKIGADLAAPYEEMKRSLATGNLVLASQINLLRASRHPELADEVEYKGQLSPAVSMIDAALGSQPQKAFQLVHDPDIEKLFSKHPGELLDYQNKAAAAVYSFPKKVLENSLMQHLANTGPLMTDVIQGKKGVSDINAALRRKDIDKDTADVLNNIASNTAVEADIKKRVGIKADLYEHASQLADKINSDTMKTVDVGVKGKASLSADVEDLFKFKNEILSAQANKAITSDEAFRMWGNIYGPFTGKIVHNNNDALWQKMSKINNYQKVDEFQAASHVLKEYLIRTGGDSDPSIKSKMYDAYFKAAETKLKPGVFNSKGVPYTPEELAHSVVGEGIGSMYQTKFGPREITKYNKQTGSPMVDLTKEDLESLGNKAALAELQKGRS